ncbi:hypothetical protein BOX15_Mlig021024g1 [Macrostomum lignano]|uniref:CID domain-containing protein n=1 Tax=Macrostomum lignano TaxID=282301 RepID=A0A267E6L7_9PLAT|nr:hypothetical protein BOX15_Mlig021024g1 [Macrostomum lignano]
MEDVNDIIDSYETTLIEQFDRPEKRTIDNLTAVIKGYLTHEECSLISQRMCELIERRLKQAKTPQERLAYLCLIDSIVKQLPQSPYAKLFSVGIASAFVAALVATDSDEARQQMFEIRRAWIGVFPDSVMRELDLAVRAIDPGWPVLADFSGGSASVTTNRAGRLGAGQLGGGGGRPDDVDMRSSWRQYRQRERQLPTAPQQPPRSLQPLPHPAGGSLDQQQAAIEALLRRVKPESLGSEARHQLLGCVRELHRLSEPDSSGRRLAESLAATLQGGSRDDNLEVPAEQIPEQVDSALEQLLSGMTPCGSASACATAAAAALATSSFANNSNSVFKQFINVDDSSGWRYGGVGSDAKLLSDWLRSASAGADQGLQIRSAARHSGGRRDQAIGSGPGAASPS